MSPVQDVIARIERMNELGKEIQQIEAAKARLPELEREYRDMQSGLIKTLNSIDVASRGNFGWERRMVHFLTVLLKEAAKHPEQQPSGQEQPNA